MVYDIHFYNISKINETLLSLDGNINIFRCYNNDPIDCIRLNMCMYFVKLEEYWVPVNPIPQFVEFKEQNACTQQAVL